MKSLVTVRYTSGRAEKFEIDFWGGAGAEARLKEFVNSPALVLQVSEELVIIPMTAIESISLSVPGEAKGKLKLSGVRVAKRPK